MVGRINGFHRKKKNKQQRNNEEEGYIFYDFLAPHKYSSYSFVQQSQASSISPLLSLSQIEISTHNPQMIETISNYWKKEEYWIRKLWKPNTNLYTKTTTISTDSFKTTPRANWTHDWSQKLQQKKYNFQQ